MLYINHDNNRWTRYFICFLQNNRLYSLGWRLDCDSVDTLVISKYITYSIPNLRSDKLNPRTHNGVGYYKEFVRVLPDTTKEDVLDIFQQLILQAVTFGLPSDYMKLFDY